MSQGLNHLATTLPFNLVFIKKQKKQHLNPLGHRSSQVVKVVAHHTEDPGSTLHMGTMCKVHFRAPCHDIAGTHTHTHAPALMHSL